MSSQDDKHHSRACFNSLRSFARCQPARWMSSNVLESVLLCIEINKFRIFYFSREIYRSNISQETKTSADWPQIRLFVPLCLNPAHQQSFFLTKSAPLKHEVELKDSTVTRTVTDKMTIKIKQAIVSKDCRSHMCSVDSALFFLFWLNSNRYSLLYNCR